MKLHNLSIRAKLRLGFGILIFFTIAVSLIGVYGVFSVVDGFTKREYMWKVNHLLHKADMAREVYVHEHDKKSNETVFQSLDEIIALSNIKKQQTTDADFLAMIEKSMQQTKDFRSSFEQYFENDVIKEKKYLQIDALGNSVISSLSALKETESKDILQQFYQARINTKNYFIHSSEEQFQVAMVTLDAIMKKKDLIQDEKKYAVIADYRATLKSYHGMVAIQQELDRNCELNARHSADTSENYWASLSEEMVGKIFQIKSIFYSFAIISLVLGSLFASLIIRLISNGMRHATQTATDMAKGSLDVTIDPLLLTRRDEVGILARSMKEMADKIREMVFQVSTGANNISSASQQLNTNAQLVSQGASEQASSAEEASSSIEQMSSNIHQNAENAQITEKLAMKAAADITETSHRVNITVEAMKQIAGKVGIIDDIAFQTNILALNAAVEAARAGEQGKGFAVVAAEVRKLAERSQRAAADINTLASTSVEEAEKSNVMLKSLVPEVERTARLIQEIAAATMEQNSGANQINMAIQQLNQIIQQNAASSEEMATNAEELESQAWGLHDVISYFITTDKKAQRNENQANSIKPRPVIPEMKTKKTYYHPDISFPSQSLDDKDKQFETF